MAGDRDGPYVGPRPFERADRSLFFGRDNEAAALTSMIVAHPVVLLYAQSGAGKSSLLNAEVIPRLETRGSEVFATMRVSGDLPSGVVESEVRNVYVYNALTSLAQWRAGPDGQRPATISEYLRTIPHPSASQGVAPIRILVFDQFEEVFTSFSERWKNRADFFDDLGAALEEDPRLRVVFAMREEFIGGLDTYAGKLPDRLRTRFRLERLGAEAALLAVTKPLETTNRTFEPEAARKLIDNLLKMPIKSATGVTDVSGEYVEPLHLQLVCTKLWTSLPLDVKLINDKYIEDLGDVDEALAAYYERCVKQVVEATGISEGTLRAWFERTLITADGVRGLVPKGDEVTGGLANDIVDRLQHLYLIRTEMRGVNPWYELTHDRFVAPIRRSNEQWRVTTGADKLNVLELEARAQRWARAARSPRELLAGRELARVVNLLASPELKAFGISGAAQDYVQASELAAATRRRWIQIGAMGVLLAIIAGVARFLYVAKEHAEDVTATVQAQIAKRLASQEGLELDAVAYGMRAVSPRLRDGRDPPPETVEGLRDVLRTLRQVIWLRGLSGQVLDLGISPDGTRAVARSNAEICAWDTATGRPLYDECLKVPLDSAPDFMFSPDRRWVYKRGRFAVDDAARLWDARTGKRVLQEQLADAQAIGFSRDGGWAAVYGPTSKLRVIELATGKSSSPLQRPLEDLNRDSLAIAPKGNLLALVTLNGAVELWSRSSGKQIATLQTAGDRNAYQNVIFSADATRVAVTSVNFVARRARSVVWSIAGDSLTGKSTPIVEDLSSALQFLLEFAPDGRTVTTITAHSAKVWSAVSGAMENEYPLAKDASTQMLDDGRLLVATAKDSETTLAVIDPLTGQILAQRRVPGELSNFDVSSDYSRFVTVGRNSLLRVYEASPEPRDLADLSAVELFRRACEKIRYQKDFSAIEADFGSACKSITK